ncbi:MAG: tetratricopeptide repeat protein [Deltaproteobacteria bacterium]|nr:MAG: tetratricopeptide repeat protein [Deltaproteobacteria bacterium]
MKRMLFALVTYIVVTTSAAWAQDAMHFYKLGVESSLANKKITYFTKALELNSNLVEAYEKRGLHYYFQRRYDKAIHDYSKVIELKPKGAEAYRMRGSAYLKKGVPESAIEDLSRAIELDPKVAIAHGDRAEAYRLAGMAAEAVHESTIAIDLRGDERTTAKAYATRAKAHLQLGHEEQSDADFDKSVQLDPRYVLIRYLAGTTNLEGVRRMGLMGIIAICFVGIFQLSLKVPRKKGQP